MKKYFLFAALALLCACLRETPSVQSTKSAFITEVRVNGTAVAHNGVIGGIPTEKVEISLTFTAEPSNFTLPTTVVFTRGNWEAGKGNDSKTVILSSTEPLEYFKNYGFAITEGEAFGLNVKDIYQFSFTTAYDPSDKFPRISDEELLTLVQRQTFKYFWDYAHPVSGLARERLGSGETVATGGSGFGIMTLPIAVERGFITRDEATQRLRTILTFLRDKAERHHGAYPHWLNGTSGATFPFSANDNGGDLVETAFLIQGLLTAAMYFDKPEEADIRSNIDAIWRGVEWDWYTRGKDALYWHWSPDREWAMNMQINGWNEGLMAYLLAASSPTHPVNASVYHNGWARKGAIRNGRKFYDITLPLGNDFGGPLFFTHYSFLGLDPRGLKDQYADYWEQNVAHARINHAYCTANPKKHAGYSAECWGLTASDISGGYTASSPTNDRGTIAPTAALSSMPYTPQESLAALRTFYYIYGDRLWGDYGFRDAFSLDAAWFAGSYIAIDQGPIVVMIENYRTGLLWDCFMKHPDIAAGLEKLGF